MKNNNKSNNLTNNDFITLEGTVLKLFKSNLFQIQLDDGRIVNAKTSGKIRLNKIKILVGDRVDVEFSVYNINEGRIIYRKK